MAELTIRIQAKDEAQPAFDSVEEGAVALSNAVVESLQKVNETSDKILDTLEETGSRGGLFSSIFTGLPGLATAAVGQVVRVFSGIGGLIGGAFRGVVSIVSGVFDAVVSVVQTTVSTIVSAFAAIPGAIGAVFNRVTAVVTAATAFIVTKLGEQAASYESLRRGAEALAKSNGTSWGAILQAIRNGTRVTVSELEAMRLANNAVLLEVAKTPEEFEKLTDAAFRLGSAVGRTATEAFEDLALGIGRQSKLILDNLGIQVRVAEANERFAESLGKTVAELSDEERTLAFRRAAFEAIDQALGRLGDTTEGLAVRFGQFRAAFADTFTDLARVVGPALGVFSDAIVPLVQRLRELIEANREIVAGRIADWAREAVGFVEGLSVGFQNLIGNTAELRAEIGDRLAQVWEFLQRAAETALFGVFAAIAAVRSEVNIFRNALADLFAGQGLDLSGSALVAVFDVLADAAQVGSLKAKAFIVQNFSDAVLRVEDFILALANRIDAVLPPPEEPRRQRPTCSTSSRCCPDPRCWTDSSEPPMPHARSKAMPASESSTASTLCPLRTPPGLRIRCRRSRRLCPKQTTNSETASGTSRPSGRTSLRRHAARRRRLPRPSKPPSIASANSPRPSARRAPQRLSPSRRPAPRRCGRRRSWCKQPTRSSPGSSSKSSSRKRSGGILTRCERGWQT